MVLNGENVAWTEIHPSKNAETIDNFVKMCVKKVEKVLKIERVT